MEFVVDSGTDWEMMIHNITVALGRGAILVVLSIWEMNINMELADIRRPDQMKYLQKIRVISHGKKEGKEVFEGGEDWKSTGFFGMMMNTGEKHSDSD